MEHRARARAWPGRIWRELTTARVDVSGAVIGERWQVGSAELEVCQPRQPCYKLGIAFDDPGMVRRFAQAGRPGAYLRITREGHLAAGDAVEILARPDHGITIATVARAIVVDATLLSFAADAPALPRSRPAWRRGCASAPPQPAPHDRWAGRPIKGVVTDYLAPRRHADSRPRRQRSAPEDADWIFGQLAEQVAKPTTGAEQRIALPPSGVPVVVQRPKPL